MKRKLSIIIVLFATATIIMSMSLAPRNDNFIKNLIEKLNKYNQIYPEEKVYLQFDKPFYKPGDMIWFKAFINNGINLKATKLSDILYVELINPKGNVEIKLNLIAIDGMANGDFLIDKNMAGGIYKVRAYTKWMTNFDKETAFEKNIQVQAVLLPRLLMKLDFEREAYGAGDKVSAKLNLNTIENTPLSDYSFSYNANINGNEIHKGSGVVDEEGEAYIEFVLPAELKSSDGLLNVIIDYEGNNESISRSIPIILNNISLQFFPEGGNLVTGVNSKVAFKALNEYGKPADIEGVVLDSDDNIVAEFTSFHQGMGAFELQPADNKSYYVKISSPVGIEQKFLMPDAINNEYAMSVATTEKEKITLNIHVPENEMISVVAQIRGKIYFSQILKATEGQNQLFVPLKKMPAGIAQITVFDADSVPRCERLTFVNRNRQMNISVVMDKEKYLPREKVKMKIKTTDENGIALPANLALSVVDDKIISFADDKQDNILSYLLISSDLKGKIYEPNFYFDKDESKAEQALDYLLMTNGWRRFEWDDINNPTKKNLNYPENITVLTGIVTNLMGKPEENADVILIEENNNKRFFKTTTDSKGYFRFDGFVNSSSVLVHAKAASGNWRCKIQITDDIDYQYVSLTESETSQIEIIESEIKKTDKKKIQKNNSQVKKNRSTQNKPKVNNIKLKNTNNENTNTSDSDKKKKRRKIRISLPSFSRPSYSSSSNSPSSSKITGGSVSMSVDNNALDECVVIGYGVAKKRSVTGAVAIIGVEDIIKMPSDIMLQGRVSGVQITQNSGIPSSSTIIKIRGVSSLNSNSEPLFVVDGFPISGNLNGAFVANDGLWPKNIERVEIIKDGCVTAIYGSRAANGVVLITTKKASNYRSLRSVKLFSKTSTNTVRVNSKINNYSRVRKFYSPDYENNNQPEIRSDFRETIYWNPHVTTNKKGEAEVSFYNSDAVTTFRATVEGLSTSGVIGRIEQAYYTQLPFAMSVKVPPYLAFYDSISIPVILKNNTDRQLSGELYITHPTGLTTTELPDSFQTINAGEAKSILIKYIAGNIPGNDNINIVFSCDGLYDAITEPISIQPKGFPKIASFSSQEIKKSFTLDVNELVNGSLIARFTAFSNPLDDMMAGIESILREPYGCFEQLSSSTYPNIMVLNYLNKTNTINSKIRNKALGLIDKGYKKLISYETSTKGYEWFGNSPAHEGLTAYGVLEFTDMKKVYKDVSTHMIDRTVNYLLNSRDGKGGFTRKQYALHNFGDISNEVMNAYIVYVLSEVGYSNLEKEYMKSYFEAIESKDCYRLALMANTLFNLQKISKAEKVLSILTQQIIQKGIDKISSEHSITYSMGKSLQVETASLIALAAMKSETVNKSLISLVIRYIIDSRGSYGGFGSTQATILALKTLSEYSQFSKPSKGDGTIEILIDQKKVATINYGVDTNNEISIKGLEKFLSEGTQTITIQYLQTENPLPYSLDVAWTTLTPNSNPECSVNLQTELSATEIKTGETVRLNTTIINKTSQGLPMTMAIVGIPSGLSVQPWQLKEIQEKKIVDFYEVNKNKVIFYFRGMAPKAIQKIALDLKAEIPGVYEAPASSAYLYYTNEYKDWSGGETVIIR